jgi:glycosyltransferase involved in cell wall biosynthesis
MTDKMISSAVSLRYYLTEPMLLAMTRARHNSAALGGDSPLVSVYTPTYNRAEILMERAVKSVLAQSYRNFEFIIIGDHCSDRTEELVRSIPDPRIRFHNIPKRGYRYPPTAENHWLVGPVVAANTALGMVQGEWIARIDDDDIWTDDHLEVLLNFAMEGDYEFVSSSYVAEKNGLRYIVDVKDEVPRIGGTQTWLYRSYLKFMKYNIHCWRKSWNRVNDTDLQERICKAGIRTGFLDMVTCYVLPRPGESTIGLAAYREQQEQKEEQYKFDP